MAGTRPSSGSVRDGFATELVAGSPTATSSTYIRGTLDDEAFIVKMGSTLELSIAERESSARR